MKLEECTNFVAGCIHDAPPPCACACPFGLDSRSFLRKVSKGRMPAAYKELRTALIFPAVSCALCSAPCRSACQRTLLGDEALDLPRLEQAVIRLAGAQAPDVFPVSPKEAAVAVVGAGPAGLSLALNMAQKKYPVTVFDRREGWGGSLRQHPDFALFDADFTLQFSAEQVTFRFGEEITDFAQLSGFSAVCVATGADSNAFGLREGWDPELKSTARPGVFLVGGAAGMDAAAAIAAGVDLSRVMEGYIQTGRATGERKKAVCHGHSLVPKDAVSAAAVLPADPEAGYTKEEAKAEAARCFQCNCSHCMTECELLAKYKKPPLQSAMEVLADSGAHFLASRTMTREVYSCNQCSWCGATCPEGVDLGELFRFSREARVKDGIQPAAFHDFWLRELDFAGGEGFFAAPPAGKDRCGYAFFPGCQLTASLPEHTLKTARLLEERLGAGVILGCCGAPAWWAGEVEKREENCGKLRTAWEWLGKPTLILACATCLELFSRLMPEIPVVSLYEVLSGLEGLSLSSAFDSCAVFDPCSARSDDGMRRGVRTLARQSGMDCTELPGPSRCCGYGGHMKNVNPELYRTIVTHRAEESDLPYLVYCANCRESFLRQGKECAHALELLFGPAGEVPHLSEKHRNALRVKGELMREMEHTEFTPTPRPWDGLVLRVPDDVRACMEESLITDDDVRECIHAALESGEGFVSEDGSRLAVLVRRVITYWVEFTGEADGSFTVKSAYCHRMHFGGEEEGA